MKKLKKALVALDLSEMDDQLLQYTKMMAESLELTHLEFIHIIPDDFIQTDRVYGIPEGTSLLKMTDSKVKNAIQQKINTYFPKTNLNLSISLREGSPAKEIILHIEENDIQLLISGRKKSSAGSGLTPKRIARKANCDFMFVTDGELASPKLVMVPLDYSENSAQALITALSMKKHHADLVIIAPHVMRLLPSDYYFGLDNSDDFIQAHLKKNKEEYSSFMKRYNIPTEEINEVFLEDHENSVSRRLLGYLKKEDFNLVIMGAQGHSAVNTFIYGSVTERFIHYCEEIPLMVVR